jgi:cytochrome P450
MGPSAHFPPGPPAPRSFGENLLRFRDLEADLLGVIGERFAVYGDFYYAPARGLDIYSTCDADVMHEVLVTQARSFLKRKTSLELLGNGLLTSDGELWRRQRRLIQPGFQRESIERYGAIITEEVEAMLERWAQRKDIELRREMQALTLGVVCRALFGQRFSGDTRRIGRAVAGVQEGVLSGMFVPPWVPTPGNVVRWHRERTLDREVFAIIDAGGEPGSLLADLIAAADESGRMSREQLRDEVVTLFLAGHETTALLLTWSLALVAQHPATEQALLEEVRATAGPGSIVAAHRNQLPLTERVLKEAMRLYPPVYVIPRVVAEPVTLGGYRIDAGAEVWLWPYFTHHDARFFARPQRFEPDRFLPGGEAERSPRAYLPFGGGSRACIGRHFALLEAVLALAAITRRFRVTLRDARPIFPHPRITLAPARPLRARVEKR